MKKFIMLIIVMSIALTSFGCQSSGGGKPTETGNGGDNVNNSKFTVKKAEGPYNESKEAYIVNLSTKTVSEKAMATAMQGIINRDGAYVFLTIKSSSAWNALDASIREAYTEETYDKYKFTEDFWIDYYTKEHGYKFTEVSLEELYNKFKDKFKGTILFGAKAEGYSGSELLLTTAAMTDSIPVNANQLDSKYSFLKDLPVTQDFRNKFEDKYAAHEWMIETYLPDTNKDLISSYFNENESGTTQADYAVQNKAFLMNLNFGTAEYSSADGYDQRDIELVDKILAHMNPLAIMWGWSFGGEQVMVRRLAEKGLFVLCSNLPNGSFHSRVKPLGTEFKQKAEKDVSNIEVDENKIYIAFMTNEGDTYKAFAGLYNNGSWLQKDRGSMPVNWGSDPWLNANFPAMMEYYYNSATENDYFFNSTSGYAYTATQYFDVNYIDDYAELINVYSKYADTEYLDLWEFANLKGPNFEGDYRWEWLKKTGMKGLTREGFTDGKKYQLIEYQNGIPTISAGTVYVLNCLSGGKVPYLEKPALLAKYFDKYTKQIKGPWFTLIYGGDPFIFKKIMEELEKVNPGRFEAVTIQELFAMTDKYKDKVDGVRYDWPQQWEAITK